MKKFFCVMTMATFLVVGIESNTQAQPTDSTSSTDTMHTSTRHDTDNNNWGLLGLVGLIGLAGLAKRNVVDRKVEFRDTPVR